MGSCQEGRSHHSHEGGTKACTAEAQKQCRLCVARELCKWSDKALYQAIFIDEATVPWKSVNPRHIANATTREYIFDDMPKTLCQRFGPALRYIVAVNFWLGAFYFELTGVDTPERGINMVSASQNYNFHQIC